MDKVAMVSGANRGIGREIALELHRRGYRLSLGMRDPSSFDNDLGAFVFRYEAREEQSARDWVDATIDHFGRLDVLVSNAGICKMITFDNGTSELLDETLDINVKAPFRLAQAALPHLKRAGNGRFVQLASLSGKRVKNLNVGYQMSKYAVLALTHAVRRAGWDDGVRATAVCPGFVNTDMAAGLADLPPDAMTQPGDIAAIVVNTLELPNTASMAELLINCRLEDML
ncbi:SDR family NAD(P)-dependent oxidoreductase [Burkholderia sp. Ac-20365]|jgi:NAD(P)-dependent dehydrogenase (short-subunit alcohol dehydrogenase family)|uniref:SDR family NAD(P)-dependent oxidoreductase n=1 Tax=Burkholderia sp. Ac-20365 TaxID=2703897 RepID=UPI00197C875F|nr:SDR family NAD(P)-dependent oxidoreductase [Burkholderia sp. Ac-20365]MBN3759841.1 SDR family NAD(P)-dependent oxidoreductase [Burkholderia sp. Ac-20365]